MNTALLAGTAVSPEGEAKASMGVDAGDFDNDGDEDLFVGELLGQGADMYVNDGMATFSDDSARTGAAGADARGHDVRGRMARRGQRRLAGPRHRERRGHACCRGAGTQGALRARSRSASCFETWERAASRTPRRRPATPSRSRKSVAALRLAISITTAIPTSSSATMPDPVRVLINNVGSRQHWVGRSPGGQERSRRARGSGDSQARGWKSVRPARPRRRQLRVGERSARADRDRFGDRACAGRYPVAGRHDELAGVADRSVHDNHARLMKAGLARAWREACQAGVADLTTSSRQAVVALTSVALLLSACQSQPSPPPPPSSSSARLRSRTSQPPLRRSSNSYASVMPRR